MPAKRLKILQVASEIAPYAKAGGLADVVGGLSRELARGGHDVRVLCPKYGFIKPQKDWTADDEPFIVNLGHGRQESSRLWNMKCPETRANIFWLEYDSHYGSDVIYGLPSDDERFAFLCRAAIEYCHRYQFFPDVIHCHDWPTGLIPVYLNTTERETPLNKTRSVFTIHNLKHQGEFGVEVLDYARLSRDLFNDHNLAHGGRINFMKGALYHSHKLTTVSPTYSHEIQEPGLGCGLDPVLRHRAADLVGILNGIGVSEWGPQKGPYIPAHFSIKDLRGKASCKRQLQKQFNLKQDPKVALFSAISRLYDQKGLDLLAEILPDLLNDMAIQVVIVGSGDPGLENRFREIASWYPGRMATFIGYDNAVAHQVQAGSDFFLMPSRFEPCGLSQIYAMTYGTLPIVRSTGGLVDTVENYEKGAAKGTGFRFHDASSSAVYHTVGWVCETYYDHRRDYLKLRRNAMRKQWGWSESVKDYLKIYQ